MNPWDWVHISGMDWFDWMDQFGAWWFVGVLLVVAVNGGLMIAGALIERRHERRLRMIAPQAAAVRLLPGPPPPTLMARPHLVAAEIVLTAPPLGRWSHRLHQIIGGYSANNHRPRERARREVLLRLREQAARIGAPLLAGVEMHHVDLGPGRTALIATGTALTPPPSAAEGVALVTEALGALPPRPWWHLALALSLLLAATLAASLGDELVERLGPWIYQAVTGRKLGGG